MQSLSPGGVLVTYRADGWKYDEVSHDALQGFEAVGFDDSGFGIGGAPFGAGGCDLGSQVRTTWDTNTDLLLRRTIDIPSPSTPLAVTVTVDNDVVVYWNGQLLGAPPPKEGCAGYDDYQFDVPTSMLLSTNTLAVRAIDRGYASFLDVAVYPSALGADPAERWPGGVDPNQTNPTGSEAEPVNTFTGAYFTSATDFQLPGRGLGFMFRRDYSSARTTGGPLGPGWVDNLGARLDFDADGNALFTSETGATIPFFADGGGGFYPAAGVLSKLSAVGSEYQVAQPDQTTYVFDTSGQLSAVQDRNGNALTFAYTNGQLTTIIDTVGRTVSLTYDPNGRLETLSGPPSRTITYGYDGNGRLASVTDANDKSTSYTYTAAGQLETIVDPNGHTVVTNEYGPDGRVSAQTDARGKRGTFDWDPATETSTFTDANGGTWVDVYDAGLLLSKTNPLGDQTTYTYDAAFQLSSITDGRGNTTLLTYDRRGNLLRRQAPSPLSTVETFGYDSRNDLAVTIDGNGWTTYYGHDTAGNLNERNGPGNFHWFYGLDPAGTGLRISATDPRGKTTTYGYDGDANLASVTTPLGNRTTMTYDAAGRLLTSVDPRGNAAGANPADYTTTYTYDPDDRLLTTTDPLGGTETRTYDDVGNLLALTDANRHTTTYVYDEDNHLASVTDAANGVTAYAYDDVGNLVSRTDANQDVTSYRYDLAKRVTSMTEPLDRTWTYGYDQDGNQTDVTDANGHQVDYVYDVLNRLSAVHYHDASTPDVTYGYDGNGNQTSMTDGAGTETSTYNPLNLLASVTRGSQTFSYGYDDAGNLTSRQYPGESAQSLTYDDDARLVSAGSTTYTYDPAGNLLTATGAEGITARYAYDRAGRLLEVANTTASQTLSRFTYALDAAGNRTAMTTREDTVTYAYDELNRLTEACWSSSSCPAGPPATPMTCIDCVGGLASRPTPQTTPTDTFRDYTYDPVGNRLSESSDAGTSTYAYNAADQLTGIAGGAFPGALQRAPSSASGQWSNGSSGYLSDDVYATASPAKNQTLTEDYSAFGLSALPADATIDDVVVSVEWAVSSSNAQGTLSAQALLGGTLFGTPLTNASSPTGDTVQTFHLSGLTRADLAGGGFAVRIGVTRAKGSNFSARLDAVSVQVSYTTSSETLSYDANGNQLSAGATIYGYDRADRLVSAGTGTATETYTYAGDGTRLSATTSGSTTDFVWDRNHALPQLAQLRDASGTLIAFYTYGAKRVSQTLVGASTSFYHADGLGSVTDLTDGTGASLAWSEYYPFGDARETASGTGAPATQPFGFAGEQLDATTGLYYLRARQYAPGTGRFLTTDPVSGSTFDPYVTAYAYGSNDPTGVTDPSGRCTQALAAAVLGPEGLAVGGSVTLVCLGIGALLGALFVSESAAATHAPSIDISIPVAQQPAYAKPGPAPIPTANPAPLEVLRTVTPTVHLGPPGPGRCSTMRCRALVAGLAAALSWLPIFGANPEEGPRFESGKDH